jgi:hypothetical protein
LRPFEWLLKSQESEIGKIETNITKAGNTENSTHKTKEVCLNEQKESPKEKPNINLDWESIK